MSPVLLLKESKDEDLMRRDHVNPEINVESLVTKGGWKENLTRPLVSLFSSVWLKSCVSFSLSLVSLIRGQVVTTDGTPLVGVNVSFVKYPKYGYTITRQDGT